MPFANNYNVYSIISISQLFIKSYKMFLPTLTLTAAKGGVIHCFYVISKITKPQEV